MTRVFLSPPHQSGREPELVYVEDRKAALAGYLEAIESGERQDVEFRVIAADGRLVWLRNSVRAFARDDGEVERLRGIIVDVSALKWAGAPPPVR